MKIVAIFAIVNNSLLSVQFKDEDSDEFKLLFDKWTDIEYLEQFFEENISDLQSGFYGDITIEEAIESTLEEAEKLESYVLKVAKEGVSNPDENRLDLVFTPLHHYDESIIHVQSKTYGMHSPSWLRLYAVRIAENLYVVSGGGIKLTKTMNEREHLRKELDKLKATQRYLKEIDLLNEDDYEFIEISSYDKE